MRTNVVVVPVSLHLRPRPRSPRSRLRSCRNWRWTRSDSFSRFTTRARSRCGPAHVGASARFAGAPGCHPRKPSCVTLASPVPAGHGGACHRAGRPGFAGGGAGRGGCSGGRRQRRRCGRQRRGGGVRDRGGSRRGLATPQALRGGFGRPGRRVCAGGSVSARFATFPPPDAGYLKLNSIEVRARPSRTCARTPATAMPAPAAPLCLASLTSFLSRKHWQTPIPSVRKTAGIHPGLTPKCSRLKRTGKSCSYHLRRPGGVVGGVTSRQGESRGPRPGPRVMRGADSRHARCHLDLGIPAPHADAVVEHGRDARHDVALHVHVSSVPID